VTNQRQHERVDIALAITLIHEGREIVVESRNISVGGMLVEGGTEIPFGATVRLKARLPGSSELDTQATVRWVQDGALGLQFVSLRAKETWAIHQLVKK
jgi:hypothetical protein